MVEADARLQQAIAAQSAEGRDQRRRLLWSRFIAASYATDLFFLALFAVAGTVPALVSIVYGSSAAVICAAQYAAYASGWNLRFRDPNLTGSLVAFGVAMQLGVVAMAPQIAFPYLANLFTVFAFGMIWLSLRESVAVWSVGVAAMAGLAYAVGERMAVPAATPFEIVLVWLYFSVILGRCLILSVQANDLRARLADSRRRLAATLEQVRELAERDELTGARNRRSIMERLEQEIGRSRRTGASFSVTLIDLDHFKRINDAHGHGGGDAVLKAFVATVHATMRGTDAFGRYGGEEFLLAMPGSSPAVARTGLERIRDALRARDWSAIAAGLVLTVSAGVAGFRQNESAVQLINRADGALYEAKRSGRDRVVVAD
jgi:diguanylate cyclase